MRSIARRSRPLGQRAQQILSLRNWLIGAWIVVYEQKGEDRAAYGTALLDRLAAALKELGHGGLSARNLANFRKVALSYPTLEATSLAASLLPETTASGLAPIDALPGPSERILQTPAKSPQAVLPWRDGPWLHRLFTELTFSHLVEFARMDDPLERAFYELHCLKEGWTTRAPVRNRFLGPTPNRRPRRPRPKNPSDRNGIFLRPRPRRACRRACRAASQSLPRSPMRARSPSATALRARSGPAHAPKQTKLPLIPKKVG